MNGIEYYKSLISDEEVIKALIKESKARNELIKEKTRVRPNLNFFQRTVTNLVTSNKRVNTTKELFKESRKTRAKIKSSESSVKEMGTTDKTSECESSQSTETQHAVSSIEEAYKEDLSKYFVPATAKKPSRLKTRIFTTSSTSKPKGIVFNLNFSKGKLEEPETKTEVSESFTESTMHNSNDDSVICVSDSDS